MKIEDPSKLKTGDTLHWHDGDTATVEHVTWGAVLVRWKGGCRIMYPFNDSAWRYFKIYPHEKTRKTSPASRRRSV
jgi:hypothetical protein